MDIKAEVYNEVIAGHAEEVKGLTAQAMEEGFDAQQLLNDSLIAGLVEVGLDEVEGPLGDEVELFGKVPPE